jgi:hypothetical protein
MHEKFRIVRSQIFVLVQTIGKVQMLFVCIHKHLSFFAIRFQVKRRQTNNYSLLPTENVRSFFGRLNKVNTVILDAYQSYTMTPPDPAIDATGNHVITPPDFQAYNKALVENVVEFYILNQFRAALLPDLRRVINLQPMHTLNLDTAVRLATIELRSKDEAKGSSKIQAVQQEDEEDNIEAISQNRQRGFSSNQNRGQQQTNRQQPKQGFRPQNNYRNNNNQQQWRSNLSNPGNNSNRNKMTCIFCRKQGHRQEECRKRINANQPCLDSNGKNFWPKVNTTENGAPVQSLQEQDFQF